MTLSPSVTRTKEQVEAFSQGKRMRNDFIIRIGEKLGVQRSHNLAKALFRDGRQDIPSVLAETQMLRSRFPETWQHLAAGLAPELVGIDGKLLRL